MKVKVISLILIITLVLVGKSEALILTQKIGSESMQTTVEEYQTVKMIFTSKEGFRFKRWVIEEGVINGIDLSSNEIEFEMPNSNITIKGEYDSEYIVTFNGNGGATTTGETTYTMGIVAEVTTNLKSNEFIRNGYKFKGWSTEQDNTTEYANGASCKPTSNITLYAVWELVTYTIEYNGNGNTSGSTASSSHTYGTEKELTANGFGKTGHTFIGWAESTAGEVKYTDKQKVINLTEEVNKTITLYAKWTVNTYTVKYNGNGSTSGSMANSNYTYGEEKALTKNAFAKTGYKFKGWALSTTGAVKYSDEESVSNLTEVSNGEVNLYAVWEVNEVTVKFESNGGSAVSDKTVTYGGTYGSLTTPTKTGYTFVGWYKESGLTNQVTNTTQVTNSATHTLYAKWRTPWNEPVIGNGMQRVNWDSSNKKWVNATASNWDYNYTIATAGTTVEGDGTARWANAMIDGDSDGTYESYYVWIPRFTYKVTEGNGYSWNADENTGTSKTEIKFSNGTDDYTTGDYSGYSTHSAFTLKDASGNVIKELTGFWVAKFEASNTSNKPMSRSSVESWRNITESEMFNYGKSLNSSIGSHMLKDSEWGAVAYLTSAVGRIPYVNSNNDYYTGYANTNQDGDGSLISDYASADGVKASTTHNIYGVYDMSGGISEYTAAYYSEGDKTYIANLVSSYSSNGTTYVDYYTTISPTGACAWLGWDSDYAHDLGSYAPVPVRGSLAGDREYAGIFSVDAYYSGSGYFFGFRVALWGFSL